jgi:FKBP-type peptidyl-prolyl cis-trans isomerase SlyD
MNTIARNTVVTLSYTVSDTESNLIDAGKELLNYLHGGYEGIFLPVEIALEGKAVGDSVTVKLQPAEAFGEYDPELVDLVSLDELPQPLTVGMQLEGNISDSDEPPAFATVTDIAGDKAVLDANHPLAGMALVFHGTVLGVRCLAQKDLVGGVHNRTPPFFVGRACYPSKRKR